MNICINIKHRKFYYCLEGCESILNLKEMISNKLNLPIDKILFLDSNRNIKDSDLLQTFLPNLSFNIQLLYQKK